VFVASGSDGPRVAVTGAGPCVFRQGDMEAALQSNFTGSAVSGIKTDATGLSADIHASADYRAHLISVMAARAADAAS